MTPLEVGDIVEVIAGHQQTVVGEFTIVRVTPRKAVMSDGSEWTRDGANPWGASYWNGFRWPRLQRAHRSCGGSNCMQRRGAS